MIPSDNQEELLIRQARERPAAERAAFLDGPAEQTALRERLRRDSSHTTSRTNSWATA
jgi:hypothetical protein